MVQDKATLWTLLFPVCLQEHYDDQLLVYWKSTAQSTEHTHYRYQGSQLAIFLKYIFRGQNANDIFISIFIYSIHPADWPYNPVNCLNAGCSLIKCFLKEHGELRDILMLVAQNNLIFFAASSLKALNPKVWIQYEVTSASAPVFGLISSLFPLSSHLQPRFLVILPLSFFQTLMILLYTGINRGNDPQWLKLNYNRKSLVQCPRESQFSMQLHGDFGKWEYSMIWRKRWQGTLRNRDVKKRLKREWENMVA